MSVQRSHSDQVQHVVHENRGTHHAAAAHTPTSHSPGHAVVDAHHDAAREERRAAKKAAKKSAKKEAKKAAKNSSHHVETHEVHVVNGAHHATTSTHDVHHTTPAVHVDHHATTGAHHATTGAHHATTGAHHATTGAHHATTGAHHATTGAHGAHHATTGAHHATTGAHVDHLATTSYNRRSSDGAFVVTTKQHFADRIVAVPEIVQREVVEEAYVSVPRRVVEREKIITVKEVVEIPEIEYIDEYVTEEYIQDIHRTIEKPITVEREVEHIIHVDDVETITVEVPEVTYDDVVVVKDVPVPTIVEKERIVERIVPQIQEEIIEDINVIHKDREVRRNIPVPVEATIKQKFIAPRITPVTKHRSYKVLLPEFSEQAVWSSCISPEGKASLPSFNNRINQLAGSSLCEVEKLFCDIKAANLEHDDWLSSEMFQSKLNLPYMGVENVNIHKPTFINTVSEAAHLFENSSSSVVPANHEELHGKSKSKFCGTRKNKNNKVTVNPQATVVKDSAPQFVQVDSHLGGHTTISPTANYARRTVVTTAH